MRRIYNFFLLRNQCWKSPLFNKKSPIKYESKSQSISDYLFGWTASRNGANRPNKILLPKLKKRFLSTIDAHFAHLRLALRPALHY